MGEYGCFAQVYDKLMSDVDYKKRTSYLLSLFEKFDKKPELLLDVACGTGNFSNLLAKDSIEVIGIDMSEDMLAIARENAVNSGVEVLYLCQKAEELDLYGTVDGAICCLDSLNHIANYNSLCDALKRISLFLEEDRLFIFDVNSVYKHKNILADNTFVIENDNVYCVWQNEFDEESFTTDIYLDFFVEEEGKYSRYATEFSERAYTETELKNALNNANLEIIEIYADMTEEKPTDNTDRLVYVTRKKREN